MAVAVIGGVGFIGSNLVDELMTQGFEVTVFDNLSEGNLKNIERWKTNKRFEFVKGDVRDYDSVRRVTDHKRWVFHLAAMSRIQPSIKDPLDAFSINMMGTANVMEACRQNGVDRVVYSASSSAYGQKNAEAAKIPPGLNEDLEVDCGSPYSLSKWSGEEIVDFYRRFYGMKTVSLRYFNVYGPRHQETGSYATVIAVFRKQKRLGQPFTVVGTGKQRRDFTFVGDVVRANMMAAMNYEVGGVLNIGTGDNYSILEVANLIGVNHPIEFIPPRLGEYEETRADISKARNLLGWQPLLDFKKGLYVLDEYERINDRNSIILAR